MNYYTFDIHRTPGGELKLLEVGGSGSAGLKFFRDGYGQARHQEVYAAYFGELLALAQGGPVFYNYHSPTYAIAATEDVRALLASPHAAQPAAFSETQGIRGDAVFRHELHEMERHIRANGLPVRFGSLPTRGPRRNSLTEYSLLLHKIGETHVLDDEEGLYVQRGQVLYPRLRIPMVNQPHVDLSLWTKLYPALILREAGVSGYFPQQLVIGMGLCSEDEAQAFLNEAVTVVVKPVFGLQGRGVAFLPGRATRFDPRAFRSPQDPQDRFAVRWGDILGSRGYVPVEFGHDRADEREIPQLVLDKHAAKDSDPTAIAGNVTYPVHEFGAALVQEYVEPEVAPAKDGTEHRGYIRAFVLNNRFLGAWYRLSREPPEDGIFDPRGSRNTIAPVSDAALGEVEAFCTRFVRDYEGALEQLGIRSVPDFVQFRNSQLRKLIAREVSARF